jgi:hypothetical protein
MKGALDQLIFHSRDTKTKAQELKSMLLEPEARQLHKQGFCVLPFSEEIMSDRSQLEHVLTHEMPEYRDNPVWKKELYLTKGGFGALGNPSSFHHPFIRDLRRRAFEACGKPLFDAYRRLFALEGMKLEQLMDRVRVLRRDAKIMEESWHRDTSPGGEPDDIIFGGWLAFEEQFFSGIPGTQLKEHEQVAAGFEKLPQSEQDYWNKHRPPPIRIPAGHILFIRQDMIHEVLPGSKKRKDLSFRLFLGWRLTSSDKPLLSNLDKVFQDQEVPTIKSGQDAKMYSNLALTQAASRENLQEWSRTVFRDFALTKRTVKGQEYEFVYQVMPSLRELSQKAHQDLMFPEYTEEEKNMYKPFH